MGVTHYPAPLSIDKGNVRTFLSVEPLLNYPLINFKKTFSFKTLDYNIFIDLCQINTFKKGGK